MPIYVFAMIGKETEAENYLNIATSSTLRIFSTVLYILYTVFLWCFLYIFVLCCVTSYSVTHENYSTLENIIIILMNF